MTGAKGDEGSREEPSFPLPMDQVFYKFNTSERRTLYDYAVEVSVFLKFSYFELDYDLH